MITAKNAMPSAEYSSCFGASGLNAPNSDLARCWSLGDWSSRQMMTSPRPFSSVASGNSSGSAYRANFRTTRWPTPASRPSPKP